MLRLELASGELRMIRRCSVFVITDDREHPIFTFNDPAELIPVRMRRHPYPSSLAFAANGELFFAAYGDLWCGEIRTDKIDEQDDFSIAAYPCAPACDA